MPKPYRHLRVEERDLIGVLKRRGESLRDIARILGRDPGTISRELNRNAPPIYRGYYLAHKAEQRAVRRNRESHRRLRLREQRIRRYVSWRIRAGWSPELTAGRWTLLHPDSPISHESIYQWVYAEARDLIDCLVRAHKRRLQRGWSRKHRKTHIPGRISITERPRRIETRTEAGHWESDTAVSRQSRAALMVTVERKTSYARLAKLKAREARQVSTALNRRLSRYPKKLRKTITYDNGSENVEHERVNAVLGTRSYFCEPYHSWERGTNENTIGLVRRFLPKKTDFAIVSGKDLKRVERWLNGRPRKRLHYRTPAEAFKDECCT